MGPLAHLAPWTATLAAALALLWARDRADLPPELFARPPLAGAPIDAAPRAAAVAEPEDEAPPAAGDTVDFARLAFDDYDPPELRAEPGALGPADFPRRARELDGLELTLEGYTQVLEVADGEVPELLLTRFPPGCCFGAIPVYDEWVRVELAEPLAAGRVPPSAAATGVLAVGEELDEAGSAVGLYRMRAARLEAR